MTPPRFWDRVHKTETCWLWTAAINAGGYGVVWVPATKKLGRAHRLAYEELVGPIPVGLELDHVKERCTNRHCVNPAHLEPVTGPENTRRGGRAVRTHCPSGHPYDETNTLRTSNGWRQCRACNSRYAKRRYYAKKAEAAA